MALMNAWDGAAMGMAELDALGIFAMASSIFCEIHTGSAPMRFMMAAMLFSSASISAFKRCIGSIMAASASAATLIALCTASCAVTASLSSLISFPFDTHELRREGAFDPFRLAISYFAKNLTV